MQAFLMTPEMEAEARVLANLLEFKIVQSGELDRLCVKFGNPDETQCVLAGAAVLLLAKLLAQHEGFRSGRCNNDRLNALVNEINEKVNAHVSAYMHEATGEAN